MAVFKCKMCGGNLNIVEGMTVCECEYCGSTQTVPQLDDEKKINLFSRANRLRFACEYDRAFGIYENIVIDFPEEAEAYWGILLCKYGIEYVDDPATGKKIPTCHRSSFDSIFDDENFEMVMEYSDPSSRSVYREEAKEIEALRTKILEVSSKEEPYDIFICYKETDAIGQRTIDSVIAQDVYEALTKTGYRVFFSRISLEDKLGQEYEPYIFAALNSAKVMVVLGTDYEYYNAVWVKNEWSRFLSLIEKGEEKTLIPCYKGIDAYDMPKEFSRLQAQDMGNIGAIQDLIRGIGKIIKIETAPASNKFSGTSNVESSALTKRGNMALEDGDFESADSFFERALDINPAEARAYLGKFLVRNRQASLDTFNFALLSLETDKDFKRAGQFADPSFLEELNAFKQANTKRCEILKFKSAISKITEKRMVFESLQLASNYSAEAFSTAMQTFDKVAANIGLSGNTLKDLKKNFESCCFVLNHLSLRKETCSLNEIESASHRKLVSFDPIVLDYLTSIGLIQKEKYGYCLTSVKEERDRRLKETEELKQKQLRQKTAYDDACLKINRQIQAEVNIVSQPIVEEYSAKIQEMQAKIQSVSADGNRNRAELQNQIAQLQRQQSSLGIFDGKGKKAIQQEIDNRKAQLNRIASSQQIEASYQAAISQMVEEQNAILNRITNEVKAKYPLPRLEDFS